MRILFHTNVDFAAWTAHLARAFASRGGVFGADAIVSVESGTATALREQNRFRFDRVEAICDIEALWLTGPAAGLEKWRAALGRGTVQDILISDRELTSGVIPHGLHPLSPLRHATKNLRVAEAYIAGMLDYLDGVLDEGHYRAIVATSVQDAPGVALAHLAKRRGIPFISPKATGFGQIINLFDDPLNMRLTFADQFQAAQDQDRQVLEQLAERGRPALQAFRNWPAAPEYMANPVNRPVPWPRLLDSAALLWRSLRNVAPANMRYPYPLARLVFEWRRAIVGRWHLATGRFGKLDDLRGRKTIYFPLHFEPEASLLVSAPEQTDQLAVIEKLHAGLPAGWLIAVKEHRPMLGRRPADLYKALSRLPNVRLIDPFISGFEVQSQAQLTATITGTAGLEAVLLGRPALFFGANPILLVNNGGYRVAEGEDIGKAIEVACQQPPADETALAAFVGALIYWGLEHPTASVWGSLDALSFEDVDQMSEAVQRLSQLIAEAADL
ncbi:capsular biosynthesis protein [Devosia salina]|uniref:Capsular biosynthesis protein n=1 Tax=Devosia salina TaxID=2860336 RepID=A0ABX8WNB6_9HYPH|nr:capsular biosynthesis protein [Devosia salina]QYO77765.1 capsular biosynthesis protein [Devosia salina]